MNAPNITDQASLDAALADLLTKGRETLGAAVPRLITQKPQIATNGLKHGLTGQNTFLSSTELSLYLTSGAEFVEEMEPVGVRENHLVQRIIDTDWRLSRIPFLQENLFRANEIREAETLRTRFPEIHEQTVGVYAQADSLHESMNDLDKLSRHETRLSRLLDSMHKEFERFQKDRAHRKPNVKFDAATSKALLWYNETLAFVERLKYQPEAAPEKYNVSETAPATATESAAHKVKLVCNLTPNPVEPIVVTHAASAQIPVPIPVPIPVNESSSL